MVKIFGKPRKDTRKAKTAGGAGTEAATASAPSTTPEPAAPARKTTTSSSVSSRSAASDSPAAATKTAAAATTSATKTTRTRRAPSTRPPRRDWAAEAASTPIDEPLPAPSSLAVAPSLDAVEAESAAAKRRRGTRGGRGRKKPGTNGTEASTAAALDADLEPGSIEALVAHQAAVLEQFTRETSAALKSLQATIADLQSGMASRETSGMATASQRVGIFVDVPNLIYATERRKVDMDFGRVLEFFTRGRHLVRATAYAPITDDPQAKLESQRFAHHFIGHPYRIVTKPLKRFADGSMKANFDIELAVDILTMSERLDVVVLMSGDGDFVRVVELVESRGVRVEVAAFAEAAANELKSVADRFIDLGLHLDEFKRKA